MNDTPPQSRLSLNSLPKVMSLNTLPKFQINGQLRDTLTRPAKSIDKGPQEKPWKSIGFIQIFLDWFGRHIDWRIPLLKQVSRWPNEILSCDSRQSTTCSMLLILTSCLLFLLEECLWGNQLEMGKRRCAQTDLCFIAQDIWCDLQPNYVTMWFEGGASSHPRTGRCHAIGFDGTPRACHFWSIHAHRQLHLHNEPCWQEVLAKSSVLLRRRRRLRK